MAVAQWTARSLRVGRDRPFPMDVGGREGTQELALRVSAHGAGVCTELLQVLLSLDTGMRFLDLTTWHGQLDHVCHGAKIATVWKYLAMTTEHSPKKGSEASSADWIRERLSPPQSRVVTSMVPGGFEAWL